jgi:hypothetical protein
MPNPPDFLIDAIARAISIKVMCSSHNLRIVSLICLLAFAVVPAGFAATITWSGAGDATNWFTTNNWFGNVVPTNTDDVLLTNGATVIVLPTNTTIRSLDITNRTLRFTGWPTTLTASNITLWNQATLTHPANNATSSPWNPDNGIFITCTTLTVKAGGAINGDGMGYRGQANTNGYGPGHGYSTLGGVMKGGGGGYGGTGGMSFAGTGGATYDTATNPASPGSAGGGGNGATGASGGGYVKIMASGTVTVDGVISMNGNAAPNWSGAGSGGGIFIQCERLTGNGTIRADSGIGASGSAEIGAGGGGRIAIYAANASSFGGQLSASNGVGYYTFPEFYRRSALPGTIYLSDWGILPGALTNGGSARFTAGSGTDGDLTISNYTLFLEWGWETNRLKAGTVTIRNNGKITHLWNTDTTEPWAPDGGIFIECSNLTVATGGQINGDGLGYFGQSNTNGYGPGHGYSGPQGVMRGGGGGYGGMGGQGYASAAYGGSTYDPAANPTNPGSAGGGGNSNPGGSGGGYARIVAAGTVIVDGLISMNGYAAPETYAAGGSGGGVYIQCQNLTGRGTICANGNNGGASGGGGGGGRIAIFMRHAPFYTSGNLISNAVNGATTGYNPGYPGTIYIDFKPRGTVFSGW